MPGAMPMFFLDNGAISLDGKTFAEPADRPYEGQDLFLITKRFCSGCNEFDKHLSRCSQCKLVFYCSTDCQRKHYRATHKKTCKELDDVLKKVKIADAGPKSEIGPILDEYPQTFRFFALHHSTVWAWEKALEADLWPLYKIIRTNGLPLDPNAPFDLLFLNRDDDAYQYVKYFLLRMNKKPDKTGLHAVAKALVDKRSVFPDDKDSRLRDIFEDCPEVDTKEIPLHYLATLCVIKLRLVAKYEPDMDKQDLCSEQRSHLTKIMDVMDAKNRYMLPSIVYPEPLQVWMISNSRRGDTSDEGTPREAALIQMPNLSLCVKRIPGAMELLERRYGTNPDYMHPGYTRL